VILPLTVVPANFRDVGDEGRKNSLQPQIWVLHPRAWQSQKKLARKGRGEVDTVGALCEGDGAFHTGGALQNANGLGGHLQRGKSGGSRGRSVDAQISSIALWEKVGKGMVGIGCTQKAYVLQITADALQVDARKQASGRGGSCFWLGTLFDLSDKNIREDLQRR